MALVNPPEHIEKVLRRLTDNGYAAYIVGGCVRDSIIGRPVHDWDIASSATPDEVENLFRKTVLTGEKYGTVTVVLPECTVEITTFRTESGYNDGRRPSNIKFVTSLNEDLSRRDFTMNAIAAEISGRLIDPFGGIADIENHVIRCVGAPDDRFSEDALRMLRAYRFSAELGFDIEPETLSSIRRNADKSGHISAERVRVELERTLLSSKPEIAGEMIKTGLLAGHMSTSSKSPDGLRELAALPPEAMLRWCAFSAVLINNGSIKSAGGFLRAMRLDAKTIRSCSKAMEIIKLQAAGDAYNRAGNDKTACIKAGCCNCASDSVFIKKLLSDYGAAAVRCAAAAQDTLSGTPDGLRLIRVDEIIGSGECFSMDALAINGTDLINLGHQPGRGIGKTLAVLLNHVIENPGDNNREDLLKKMMKNGILN